MFTPFTACVMILPVIFPMELHYRRRFELRVRGKKSGKSVKLRQAKNYETGCIRLQFVGCRRLALVTIRGRPVYPSLRALRNVKQLWNNARGRRRAGFLARALVPLPKKVSTASAFAHSKVSSPISSPIGRTPHALASNAALFRSRYVGVD